MREATPDNKRMGYKRSLVVKHTGGQGGLPITDDVDIELRSGHGLDAIVLEWNNGRLGENRWWWILLESGSFYIYLSWRRTVSREFYTYQYESVGLHEG